MSLDARVGMVCTSTVSKETGQKDLVESGQYCPFSVLGPIFSASLNINVLICIQSNKW